MSAGDQQPPPTNQTYALQPTNTLAGPSTIPEIPPVFLPPPSGYPPARPYFDSTQDLITRFQLLAAYDKYVRPHATPVGGTDGSPSSGLGAMDKGKGKEKDVVMRDISSPAPPATPAVGNDGDDEDGQGKGEKKWKNYKHLIKGIPGKHSMKKDDYLMTMIQIPPKQRISIQPFDLRTQRDAFSVSLEGLKGWNINALVAESPQAREDRKRRKELKKLAKAQAQGSVFPPGASPASGQPGTPVVGTPGLQSQQQAPARTGTPRLPSGSHVSHSSISQPRGHTPAGVGTPRSISTSGAPPTTTTNAARQTSVPTPAATPAVNAMVDGAGAKRGLKREREDTPASAQQHPGATAQPQAQGVTVNTNGAANPGFPVGAKAGTQGVRPRPIKKQRMDTQGHAREMPVQQPTPHA